MSDQAPSASGFSFGSRLPRRSVLAAGIVSLILLAAVTVAVLNASSPDYDAVRAVVTKALHDSQSLPAPAAAARAASRGLAPSQWLSEASATFASEYTGDILARKISLIASASSGGNDGIIAGDAGVENIVFKAVGVSGATATVVVTATAWATITEAQPGQSPVTANPTGVVDWTISLVKTADGWRINGENMTFEPGSGP